MTKVLLHDCYSWTCKDCGKRNMAYPVKTNLSVDQREEVYRAFKGLDKWQELPENWERWEFSAVPTQVTCHNCSHVFSVQEQTIQ